MTITPDYEPNYIPGVGFVPAAPPPAEPAWKTDPRLAKKFVVNGQEVTLFTIGALAEAMGKAPVTIRLWIRQGVIPDAGMRTGPIKGTRGDAGRRLFTLEQIEALVRIAKSERVMGEGIERIHNFSKTTFGPRVWALWEEKQW